ncbi:hypothetical protein RV10_GL002567 [Enterococcus pallens]|nr:hypothetical protein RV10_GL002567 [Enterococcus pallens]
MQVFNEKKLLLEISCCDEELALRMYDFFVIPIEQAKVDYLRNDNRSL